MHQFIHSVFCLTTGSKTPLKRFLHIVRSRASSFKWEYPLLFLRSSSSLVRLLHRLLVTPISPFIFPLISSFRKQFLRKMWPNKLAFRFLISCRIVLCSLTVSNQLYSIYESKIYYIKTLKMFLHISILRSSSGSAHCSLLKLNVKMWICRYVYQWCGSVSSVCGCVVSS
jgi:hypothetical protein